MHVLIVALILTTLFWINLAVGGALAALSIALAPLLVAFYGEPRLYWITIVLGLAFVFGGLAAQHRAMIMRNMRFATLAKIDVLAKALCKNVLNGEGADNAAALATYAKIAMTRLDGLDDSAFLAGAWSFPAPADAAAADHPRQEQLQHPRLHPLRLRGERQCYNDAEQREEGARHKEEPARRYPPPAKPGAS